MADTVSVAAIMVGSRINGLVIFGVLCIALKVELNRKIMVILSRDCSGRISGQG